MDNNEAVTTTTETGGQEGTAQPETIALSKTEYEELVGMKAAYGSLKREMKDIKKSLETKPEAPAPSETNYGLVEKTFLRSAGIVAEDEVALAKDSAAKWGMSIDTIVDDPDFQMKLERHRTNKANVEATSGVRGDKSGGSAKDSTAYWIAKGNPPSRTDVPDDATRRKIVRDMMGQAKSTPKFYNQ